VTTALLAAGGLTQNWGAARYVLAMLVIGVLLYWTLERIWGEGDDPTLRMTSSSNTGAMVMLMSGTKAVLVLVGLAALFLGPELLQGNALVIGALGCIVVAHWMFEKEERE